MKLCLAAITITVAGSALTFADPKIQDDSGVAWEFGVGEDGKFFDSGGDGLRNFNFTGFG